MDFGDVNTDKGIKKLNTHLSTRSYISGYQPSDADVDVFEKFKKPPQDSQVHVLRWYNHIKSFSADERKHFVKSVHPAKAGGETTTAPVKPAQKAPAKPAAEAKPKPADDDDDVDLFGSDEEEDAEAAKIREERLKAYADKKSKKPVLIAKSSIVLDVKPWDDETDMKKMEELVRTIKMEGLIWGASKLVPVGYGINKLQIMCVVEDDKVSVDALVEEIQQFEECVQSVDIAAFNKI